MRRHWGIVQWLGQRTLNPRIGVRIPVPQQRIQITERLYSRDVTSRGCSSVGRAEAFQASGRRFESVHPLHMGYCPERQRGLTVNQLSKTSVVRVHHAPLEERYIRWLDSLSDKEKVGGSNPPRSTNGKMAEWPKARAC